MNREDSSSEEGKDYRSTSSIKIGLHSNLLWAFDILETEYHLRQLRLLAGSKLSIFT